MKSELLLVVLSIVSVVAGCQPAAVSHTVDDASVFLENDIKLHPLAEGVWVHTSYFDLPDYGRCPANGLVIVDGGDALLIDLPWTDEQTATLFDWVAERQGATVKAVVPTHFHQDCLGGLAEAHRRGVMSYGLDKTIAIARQRGLPVPKIPYRARIPIRCGGTMVVMTYHGAGHTLDNVVAWLPKQKILFGGCLLKSLGSDSLGHTTDGDLQTYPTTLQRIRNGYPAAKLVVPGHGDWGGPELIGHTLKLCAQESTRP